jgi:hypothetical protein
MMMSSTSLVDFLQFNKKLKKEKQLFPFFELSLFFELF